jgi:hypothetical protein
MAAISPINPLTVIAMKKRSMGAIMISAGPTFGVFVISIKGRCPPSAALSRKCNVSHHVALSV